LKFEKKSWKLSNFINIILVNLKNFRNKFFEFINIIIINLSIININEVYLNLKINYYLLANNIYLNNYNVIYLVNNKNLFKFESFIKVFIYFIIKLKLSLLFIISRGK